MKLWSDVDEVDRRLQWFDNAWSSALPLDRFATTERPGVEDGPQFPIELVSWPLLDSHKQVFRSRVQEQDNIVPFGADIRQLTTCFIEWPKLGIIKISRVLAAPANAYHLVVRSATSNEVAGQHATLVFVRGLGTTSLQVIQNTEQPFFIDGDEKGEREIFSLVIYDAETFPDHLHFRVNVRHFAARNPVPSVTLLIGSRLRAYRIAWPVLEVIERAPHAPLWMRRSGVARASSEELALKPFREFFSSDQVVSAFASQYPQLASPLSTILKESIETLAKGSGPQMQGVTVRPAFKDLIFLARCTN